MRLALLFGDIIYFTPQVSVLSNGTSGTSGIDGTSGSSGTSGVDGTGAGGGSIKRRVREYPGVGIDRLRTLLSII